MVGALQEEHWLSMNSWKWRARGLVISCRAGKPSQTAGNRILLDQLSGFTAIIHTNRLDSSTHSLTKFLLTAYHVLGAVLSSGGTLGKKLDLLHVFMNLKCRSMVRSPCTGARQPELTSWI